MIYQCIGTDKVRQINFTDFRETQFSDKSFLCDNTLEVGKFYDIVLDHNQKFKVKSITPAQCPTRYSKLCDHIRIRENTKIDPIDFIRQSAERLHFIKRSTSDFFKNKRGVFVWLLQKRIMESDAS